MRPFINEVELILVMTVEPGFGGQRFMADMMPKVQEIRRYIDAMNPTCELEVDGGVDPATCKLCIASGANVLVAGSSVYKAEDIPARIRERVADPLHLRNIFTEKDIILWNISLRPLKNWWSSSPVCRASSKSAQRLAFHVLNLPMEQAQEFANAIVEAKQKVTLCPICRNLTAGGPCPICANPKRDESLLCVVADPRDVIAMERAREFHGRYHVLHGVLSPMNHVGPRRPPDQAAGGPGGTGRHPGRSSWPPTPTPRARPRPLYLARLLKPFGVKVTRLAYGIPVGGHLEFADDATLTRALEGRQEL